MPLQYLRSLVEYGVVMGHVPAVAFIHLHSLHFYHYIQFNFYIISSLLWFGCIPPLFVDCQIWFTLNITFPFDCSLSLSFLFSYLPVTLHIWCYLIDGFEFDPLFNSSFSLFVVDSMQSTASLVWPLHSNLNNYSSWLFGTVQVHQFTLDYISHVLSW